MNINNLTSIIYSNLSKKIKFEPENVTDETLQNINKLIPKDALENSELFSSKEQLKMLLSAANLPATKENINLIKSLIQNNLPANQENIQTMVKSTKIFKDLPIEKALFLIQNNLKPTLNTANQIEGYISKDISISKQLDTLFLNLSNLDNIDNLENIFKNTTLQQDVKTIVSTLKNIKTEILNTVLKGEIPQNKNINNSIKNILNIANETLNLIKQQNPKDILVLQKYDILKNVLELTLDKDIVLNENKLKDISEIFENINKDIIISNSSNKNNQIINDKNITFNKDFNEDFNLPKNINTQKNEIIQLKNEVLKQIFKNPEISNQLKKDILNIVKFIQNNKDTNKNNIDFKQFLTKVKDFQSKTKYFDFENNSQDDLNVFFKDITNICKNTQENIINFNKNEHNEILKNLDNINKNLDFMINIRDSTFLQIPININDFSVTAELYIFSDKKNKNKNIKKNSGSALLSLNLCYLGKLEAYITKVDNDISCQFRLKEENTKNLLKQNVHLLDKYLKEKNLILKEISFKDLDQNFNIITNNVNNNNLEDIQISNFNTKA